MSVAEDILTKRFLASSAQNTPVTSILKDADFAQSCQGRYQINVKYENGKKTFCGFEVLARDKFGNSPITFIDDLRENGHLAELDFNIFKQGCAFIQTLQKLGFPIKNNLLNINLSAPTIETEGRLHRLMGYLEDHDVEPKHICLEIVEDDFTSAFTNSAIALLKKAGLKVIIDDFGTGASLADRVEQLKPDGIKIDITLINKIYKELGIQKDQIGFDMLMTAQSPITAEDIADKICALLSDKIFANAAITIEGLSHVKSDSLNANHERDILIDVDEIGHAINKNLGRPIKVQSFDASSMPLTAAEAKVAFIGAYSPQTNPEIAIDLY